MDNPFLKRATEFFRDDEAFLAVVSPEPITFFLKEDGSAGSLYDRYVVIRGTPGSGKTTLARLFEYPTLAALLRNRNVHQELVAVLADCRAIKNDAPCIVGCRLPMETDYRDFWEFPYPEDLKCGLMTALIQARAVLGWIRGLVSTGVSLNRIAVTAKPGAEAAAQAIGGTGGERLFEKARAVESAVYAIVSALVPPDVKDLTAESTDAYRPFDVIDEFKVVPDNNAANVELALRPLVILDDAHILHPSQFTYLQRWLSRRELRVARWVLTRLDVLHPGEVLAAISEDRSAKRELPGITKTRETVEILLQSGDRTKQRRMFRGMAKDMADRYLRKTPLFSQRRLHKFSDLLYHGAASISASDMERLRQCVSETEHALSIAPSRMALLRQLVDAYRQKDADLEDVRLQMLMVLMHRYVKRTGGRLLFQQDDPEPSVPLAANSPVYDAARIQLLHEYGRPYYVGIDDLCDASSENAEQFLRLAAGYVEALAAKIIRSRPAVLDAKQQNKLLREQAEDIVRRWDFPHCHFVRGLTDAMAQRCLEVSLEPNAHLGAGANAFGIPQDELEVIPSKTPELARVLQYAIAYNAISMVPRYGDKGKMWCLLELGGTVLLKYGLTLKRGGFIESTSAELSRLLQRLRQ
jgi:hypothetical protein